MHINNQSYFKHFEIFKYVWAHKYYFFQQNTSAQSKF